MPAFNYILVFTLTSSFRLLLTLYRRLFVVFSFTNLCDNAVSCTRSLETLQSCIQSFVLTNTDFCQNYSLPLPPVTEAILSVFPKINGDSEGVCKSKPETLYVPPVLLFRTALSLICGIYKTDIITNLIILYFHQKVNSFLPLFLIFLRKIFGYFTTRFTSLFGT